jgi:hypothetical protein
MCQAARKTLGRQTLPLALLSPEVRQQGMWQYPGALRYAIEAAVARQQGHAALQA